ncbi:MULTISPECIES: alpha/beta-type small acid-soluble spore protein [unclassified Carboxydocella]|uniref:alpha/beta-type small acid-soluble spore protein n=1 Tax=unclassified Carboxydocella TaxID=2685367 RepID=UPI0009AE0C43|nr:MULTISPECIES: alpha/beta-type small acid-soluble spore protein [unclassified Carboxydocella]GAW27601.1 small acid-soluble spore protein alpha/beta type [Carboxydocella sp. ULO1]GAW31796.1 small acid-soluble spore protein alpha/beta type [Carboxydocella sp. JDF658]
MARRKRKDPVTEAALKQLKFEVAQELGIPLNEEDNGDLTTRQVGKIGGTMVKRLIELGQRALVAEYEARQRRSQMRLVHAQRRPQLAAQALGVQRLRAIR